MSFPVYLICEANIHDPEKIKPYLLKIEETLKAYGGKRIVAGGRIEIFEGTPPQGKLIIIQFDSTEKAHAWHNSPEYQAIKGYRLASADCNVYLVDGAELSHQN